MHKLARIIHAFARGARIECRPSYASKWSRIHEPGFVDFAEYRVLEEDAHLEYGRLSTALREYAMYDIDPTSKSDDRAALILYRELHDESHAYDYETFKGTLYAGSEGDNAWRMSLILVAEYLADQGL